MAYGKWGIARTYALIFGLAYVGVALLEVILGDEGWVTGNTVILGRTTEQNAVHWAVGVLVLGSFFAGESAARTVARIVGVVFVVVTVLGVVANDFTGELLGFPEDFGLPVSYNIVHALTAIVALYAGFASSRASAGPATA